MKNLFLYFLPLLFSGCALHYPAPESYDTLSAVHADQVKSLAAAVSERISARYPQRLVYVAESRGDGMFGDALRYARGRNNALAMNREMADLSVIYALGELDGDGYLNLRFSDGAAMAQSFAMQPSVADVPSAGPSSAYSPAVYQVPPRKTGALPTQTTVPEITEASLALSALPSPESPSKEETLPNTGGQNQPLRLAVLSHLPPTWKYTIPDVSKREIRVSWPEDASWRTAISMAAEQAGCRAEFDEDARRVRVVTISATLPASSVAPAIPNNAEDGQAVPAALADAHIAATPVMPDEPESPLVLSPMPAPDEWSLSPGSLCAQLQTWADRGGYQLVWKASHDLNMEVRANFRGGFLEALRQLFQGLHKSGNALRVTIYTANHVIEIAED